MVINSEAVDLQNLQHNPERIHEPKIWNENSNTISIVIIYYDPLKAAVYTYLTNGFWTWARTNTSPILREVAPQYTPTNHHKLEPALFSYHCESITFRTHTQPAKFT